MSQTYSIADVTEKWMVIARALTRSRRVMTYKSLLVLLGIATIVPLSVGVHSYLLSLSGQSAAKVSWYPLTGGLLISLALFWIIRKKRIRDSHIFALMGLIIASNLIGVALNGLPALTFVVGIVVFCHLLTRSPRTAGMISAV